MKKKQMLVHIFLFVVFWGFVIAPYWVTPLDRVTPTFLGLPFLICYYVFFCTLNCINLYIMNRDVSESYTEEETDVEKVRVLEKKPYAV